MARPGGLDRGANASDGSAIVFISVKVSLNLSGRALKSILFIMGPLRAWPLFEP